ncbi:MAG: VWA domain-containing protein [Ruminococcus sp.]|jgi:uncharacterized protein YegL|nr:VWA domain-containing protein [Ruminococcus sp.]
MSDTQNSILENVPVPRKTMVLFFLIDTSGSMFGTKIGSVNNAIEEIIPDLKKMSESNPDAEIKIAAMEFSNGVKWVTPEGPVPADVFRWEPIEAMGVTDLGAAFTELREKLSKNSFMKEAAGSYAPVIFLMTDGEPTDEWQKPLEELTENKWFTHAIKIALAVGDDANEEVLKKFTANEASVVKATNSELLKKMIKFVSVRSSQVASRSAAAVAENGVLPSKQEEFLDELKTAVEEMNNEVTVSDDEWD